MHCLEVKCSTHTCHVLDLAKNTVHTFYNNVDRIKGSAKMGTKVNSRRIFYLTSSTMECMKNFEYFDQGAESVACVCK
jgi:hypothetical protein